ncbi:hypothetical protein [Desulfocastanea catecholica]
MSISITIQFAETVITDCESVILVPEIAAQEAGYIKTFTVKDSGHAKHEYHALAQMAYFQFQDDELEIMEIDSPLTIHSGEEVCEMAGGMVLYRDAAGSFHVLAHAFQKRKKLLEAAYRYCTRWVRLDI